MLQTIGRRAKITVVSLIGCFGLSACLDLDQTFIVEQDGSATFDFAFTIDGELLEMGSENDLDPETTCESDQFLQQNIPPTLTQVSNARFEDGSLICQFTISGPLTDFEELSANFEKENRGGEMLSLEILDDHRLQIVSVYNFSDAGMGTDGDDDAMIKSIKRMMFANFEGHYINLTIQAPTILESNGDIAPDGKSVTWSLPLKDALISGGEYRIEAVIDYKNQKATFF